VTNIEQNDDGTYNACCEWCGEEFTEDSEAEALNKEGVHRAEHIDTDSVVTKKTHNRNAGRKGNKSIRSGIE
jgi:hypothetical protein